MNKEEIKEFLKPTKYKVLLFLIFAIILINMPFISCQDTSGPVYHLSFWEYMAYWENNYMLFDTLLYGVPILIISYLLSSMIFFIYKNFKSKIGLISLVIICIVLVGLWWTHIINQIDGHNRENYQPWFLQEHHSNIPQEIKYIWVHKELNCIEDSEPWGHKRNEYNQTYEQIFNKTHLSLMNKRIKNYYKENYNITIYDIRRESIEKQVPHCLIDTMLFLQVAFEDRNKMLQLDYN